MRIKKLLCLLTAAAMVCGMAAGCSSGDTESESEAVSSQAEESSSEAEPQTDEEWTQAMLEKSLVSYGNVTKMQEKLTAAQNGEEINISYLGGSITEGVGASTSDLCYAKLSYDHVAEAFGTGENVTYNNAGISGTPSKLGVLRLDRDVLAYDPDICFIEFAVNDGTDTEYQTAYESIIRTLIENDVAVVLLFSRTSDGYSAQSYYMQEQGEYYDLPMISYNDAITYMIDNGQMTWEEFSDDTAHPNDNGHQLVADMIANYFDTVMDQTAEEYSYPEETLTSAYQYGAHMYENTDLTADSEGSWTQMSNISYFTNGWQHAGDADNEPITFTITGKFVYLIYHEESAASQTYGIAHITITKDGEPYEEIDVDSVSSDGWGNPQVRCIGMSSSEVEYEITIEMAEGSEDKYFEILGFGYTTE